MSSTPPDKLTSKILKEHNDQKSMKDDKPSNFALVCDALKALGSRNQGASLQVIKEWIVGNCPEFDTVTLASEIEASVTKGLENGIFKQTKNSETSQDTKEYFVLTVNEIWLEDDEEDDVEDVVGEIMSAQAKKVNAIVPGCLARKEKKLNRKERASAKVEVANKIKLTTSYVSNLKSLLHMEEPQIPITHGMDNVVLTPEKQEPMKGVANMQKIGLKTSFPKETDNAAGSSGRKKLRTTSVLVNSTNEQETVAESNFADDKECRSGKMVKDLVSRQTSLSIPTKSPIAATSFSLPSETKKGLTPISKPNTMLEGQEKAVHLRTKSTRKAEKSAKNQMKISDMFKKNMRSSTRQKKCEAGIVVNKEELIVDHESTISKHEKATPVPQQSFARGKSRIPLPRQNAVDGEKQAKPAPKLKNASTKAKASRIIKVKIERKPPKATLRKTDLPKQDVEMIDSVESARTISAPQFKRRNDSEPALSNKPELKTMDNGTKSNQATKFKLFKEHLENSTGKRRTKSAKPSSTKVKSKGTDPDQVAPNLDVVSKVSESSQENVLDTELIKNVPESEENLAVNEKQAAAQLETKTDSNIPGKMREKKAVKRTRQDTKLKAGKMAKTAECQKSEKEPEIQKKNKVKTIPFQ